MYVVSATKSYEAASASSITRSIVSTGGVIVACIPESRAVTISSITYNSVAGTLLDSQMNGNARAYMYYWLTPAVTTANLVVTYSGAITQRVFGCVEIGGVDLVSPFGAPVKSTGSAQNKTFSVTTTRPNSIILDCFADLGNSHTAASGQTIMGTEFATDALNRLFSYRQVAAAGATSNTWNGNVGAADYAGIIVEVKGADFHANQYYRQQQAAI